VRLEFDSLIRTFFESFVNHFIKADFKEIDSKKVFVVNVKPSNKPVFLKNKENDLVTKEFYIRKSASSEKIHDLEEIVDYCLIHFNG
jgi:Rieske Fe-S protein